MKSNEIREMSDEQLEESLKDSCESLFRLRIQAQTERLDAPSELRRQQRQIARIKTEQRQREIVAEKKAAEAKKTAETKQAAST